MLAVTHLPLAAQPTNSSDSNSPAVPTAPNPPAPDESSPPAVSAMPTMPERPRVPQTPQFSGGQGIRIDDHGIFIDGPHSAVGFSGPSGYAALIAVAAILIPFIFLTGIVGIIFEARRRKNQELHQTLRMMIEKGVPIPPELLRTPPTQPVARSGFFGGSRVKSDLRSGLVWIAIGLGVMFCLIAGQARAWPVGFIPLFMGCAFLLTWKLDKKNAAKSDVEPK
jgi:hypothetical protein